MSAETFLLLTLLAQRVHLRLYVTVNALYKLLAYFLTLKIVQCIGYHIMSLCVTLCTLFQKIRNPLLFCYNFSKYGWILTKIEW